MREPLASYDLPYERRRGNVRRLQPLDLGEVLRPLPPDDELLEDARDV